MQAQALALVLEERDKKRQMDQTSADPPVQPPSAASVVPPLPNKQLPSSDPVQACDERISVAMLRLLEAELDHAVSFGSQPLTASELETELVAAKAPGKSLNAFIVRHGNGKSPPTRVAAKAKLAAAILKDLRFSSYWLILGVWVFGVFCGLIINFGRPPVMPFPRTVELFQAWWTINFSHSDLAVFWQNFAGVPIITPGARAAFFQFVRGFM